MSTRNATELSVLVGGVIQPAARVLTIEQASGSQRVNSATFEIESLHRAHSLLQDRRIVDLLPNSPVLITRKRKDGSTVSVHRGAVSKINPQFNGSGEKVVYTSRLDSHMVGSKYTAYAGQSYMTRPNAWSTSDQLINETVFNPIVDGELQGNLYTKTDLHNAYFEIEAVPVGWFRTDQAKLDSKPWKVTEVAYWLCYHLLNRNHVKVPTFAELAAGLGNIATVREFRVKIGEDLVDVLDRLLRPYGVTFTFQPDSNPNVNRNHIKLIARTLRTGKWLQMAKYGEAYSSSGFARSEVTQANISIDKVAQAANAVWVFGERKKVESTFELVPAWHPDYDSTELSDLTLNSDAVRQNPLLARVWRDWVLNEGGDYYALGVARGKLTSASQKEHVDQLKSPYEFKGIVGQSIGSQRPLRRRFLPTLTRSDNESASWGEWDGVFVEFWDGAAWQPISGIGDAEVKVLKDECGIRFTNTNGPPGQLVYLGLGVLKLRVTATVQFDERPSSLQLPGNSLLSDGRFLVIEDESYVNSEVDDNSIFYVDIANCTLSSNQQDSLPLIEEEARSLLESWNQATMSGTVTLDGCDVNDEYMGEGIAAIQPRNITLGTAHAREPSYVPVCVHVEYDIQEQVTRLTMDSYRRAR